MSFKNDLIFDLGNYMRDTRDELFRKQYIQMRTLFTPLCLESHYRYCFKMLSVITLLYQLYIDNEVHHKEYTKKRNCLTDNVPIEVIMNKWYDDDILIKIKGK